MEDAIQARRWNSYARIPYRKLKRDFLGPLRFDSHTDGDFTPFGELDPVFRKTKQDLQEPQFVADPTGHVIKTETLSLTAEVVARGLPPGLGSFAQWDRKLDGRLAQALMSIHAVKAVAIGAGFAAGDTAGSAFHDEILFDDEQGLHRGSNRAGGLEGGVTNGEELRAQAVVKPIPTLLMPLRSIDMKSKEPQQASVERSDTCVVPAAGVVGEAMVAWTLADAVLEKAGGDSLTELLDHLAATRSRHQELLARR
jgi:chorismate synthase